MIQVDMTTAANALRSLEAWLKIDGAEIQKYVAEQKSINYFNNFLEYFSINDTTILSDTIRLAFLHVTTNNDDCDSIKRYGLMNLQETIRLDTPLGDYLRELGIIINLAEGLIEYYGELYDIKEKDEYTYPGSKGSFKNNVIRKLYEDYQINGFFCDRNVLRYGGGVNRRPEILYSLSKMLINDDIAYSWIRRKNNCYVLKCITEMSALEHYTFDVKVKDAHDYKANRDKYELKKRNCLIINALTVIFDDMFGYSLPEFFSYAKFETKIPFDNIEVFKEHEYIANFKVNLY